MHDEVKKKKKQKKTQPKSKEVEVEWRVKHKGPEDKMLVYGQFKKSLHLLDTPALTETDKVSFISIAGKTFNLFDSLMPIFHF